MLRAPAFHAVLALRMIAGIAIRVTDRGIGIARDALETLFDQVVLFHRLE
ncbi:hypothetical protein [Burkholderia sp. BCC0322]|nr:hypothetical protein [Burkholderia sp. BCC0322]